MIGALFSDAGHSSFVNRHWMMLAGTVGLLFLAQLYQYWKNDSEALFKAPLWARVVIYYLCFYSMIIYGQTGGQEFIYFQF